MSFARMRLGVGATALAFVLALALGITGVIAPTGSVALGASTTLTIISGEVLVSHAGAPFEPAGDGLALGATDVIKTTADARAVLTYFEGSTVSMEPDTELRIDDASTDADGSTILVMTQNLGRTWHVVTRLVSGNSRYDVRTPNATASVRGTAFEVGLTEDPATGDVVSEVTTTEGAVAATVAATPQTPDPEPVVVVAGFTTTVKRGDQRPEQPRPAPEPERRVTVDISTEDSLVVDPLGRANGVKDGKVVLQTPGAQVTRGADGKLTVVLPNVPDGKISAVVNKKEKRTRTSVDVKTTVQERGKDPVTVEETVVVEEEKVVTGVEVKRTGSDEESGLRRLRDEEKQDLKPEKVAERPELPQTASFRHTLEQPLESTSADDEDDEDGDRTAEDRAPLGLGSVGPATGTERSESDEDDEGGDDTSRASSGERSGDRPRSGFVPAFGRPTGEEEGRKAAADVKRAEAARQEAERMGRAAEDARRRADEEQRRAEDARRAAEEDARRAAAESRRLDEAWRAADEAKRGAEEQARRAPDQPLRRAAEEEAKRLADVAKRLEDEKRANDDTRHDSERVATARGNDTRRLEEAKRAADEARRRAEEEAERRAKELRNAKEKAERLEAEGIGLENAESGDANKDGEGSDHGEDESEDD